MPELPEIFIHYYPEPVLLFLKEKAEQNKVNYFMQRSSKVRLGTFRSKPLWQKNEIHVARNLEPDIMLIVLCHELAHAEHYLKAKRRAKPHGPGWKKIYVQYLSDIKTIHTFSEESLKIVNGLIENPKASLEPPARELKQGEILLSDLPMGAFFQSGRTIYLKKEFRRTRFLCVRQSDNRAFAFRADAVVKRV